MTKEILKMEKDKVMEFRFGQMEPSMKENGRTEKQMGKASSGM